MVDEKTSKILNVSGDGCGDYDKYIPYIDAIRGLFVSSLDEKIYNGLSKFVYNQDKNSSRDNLNEKQLNSSIGVSNFDKLIDAIWNLDPINAICPGSGRQDAGIFERVLRQAIKYFIKEGLISCFLNSIVLNNRLNRIHRELDDLSVNNNFLKTYLPWNFHDSNNLSVDKNNQHVIDSSHEIFNTEINLSQLKNDEIIRDKDAKCFCTSRENSTDEICELLRDNYGRCLSEEFHVDKKIIKNKISDINLSQDDNWTKENLKIHICQANNCSDEKLSLPIKSECFIRHLDNSGSFKNISKYEKFKKNFKNCLDNICKSLNDILKNFDGKIIRKCCLLCRVHGDYLKLCLKRKNKDGCKVDLYSDLIVIHENLECHHDAKLNNKIKSNFDRDKAEEVNCPRSSRSSSILAGQNSSDDDLSFNCSCDDESHDEDSFRSAKSIENIRKKKPSKIVDNHEDQHVVDDKLLKDKLLEILKSITNENCRKNSSCPGDYCKSVYVQTSENFEALQGPDDCHKLIKNKSDLELKIFEILETIINKNSGKKIDEEKNIIKHDSLIIIQKSKSLTKICSPSVCHSVKSIKFLRDNENKTDDGVDHVDGIPEPRSLDHHINSPGRLQLQWSVSKELFNDYKSSLICILSPSKKSLNPSHKNILTLTCQKIADKHQNKFIKSSLNSAHQNSLGDNVSSNLSKPKIKKTSKISCSSSSLNNDKFLNFTIEIKRLKLIIKKLMEKLRYTFSKKSLKKLQRLIRKKIIRPLLMEREKCTQNNGSKIKLYEKKLFKNFSEAESIESFRYLPRKNYYSDTSVEQKMCCQKKNNYHDRKSFKKTKFKAQCSRCKIDKSKYNYQRHENAGNNIKSMNKNCRKYSNKGNNISTNGRVISSSNVDIEFKCPEDDEECPGLINNYFRSILTQYVNLCKNVKYSFVNNQTDVSSSLDQVPPKKINK
ncbi:hypothetical protein HCN44_011161 [Aphidius gifuensis]|uniref:Uncharacterized protein n=1 Tax=Aphidius gifuensis TaxID=684658 RepID=A0A834XYB3_APHGI|nr:uncharacterized protein LOC122851251 [Aphidius gifuensis]KAF7993892.1 hypothetical protein HCN44_011161 [Aphidius gifuensis]